MSLQTAVLIFFERERNKIVAMRTKKSVIFDSKKHRLMFTIVMLLITYVDEIHDVFCLYTTKNFILDVKFDMIDI